MWHIFLWSFSCCKHQHFPQCGTIEGFSILFLFYFIITQYPLNSFRSIEICSSVQQIHLKKQHTQKNITVHFFFFFYTFAFSVDFKNIALFNLVQTCCYWHQVPALTVWKRVYIYKNCRSMLIVSPVTQTLRLNLAGLLLSTIKNILNPKLALI